MTLLSNRNTNYNFLKDPTLLFPGVADRKYLEPMYDVVAQEIRSIGQYENLTIIAVNLLLLSRKYDDHHIILFEGVTWEVTGIGEAIGFTHAPGGDDYRNRSILSFHHSVAVSTHVFC